MYKRTTSLFPNKVDGIWSPLFIGLSYHQQALHAPVEGYERIAFLQWAIIPFGMGPIFVLTSFNSSHNASYFDPDVVPGFIQSRNIKVLKK